MIYPNQRICLGIDDIVTRGILNPDGSVPQVKMCSSLESEHYLPPGGNAGMQRLYLCSAYEVLKGEKRNITNNNMAKRYVLKRECGIMWMKTETISFRRSVVKLVLPQ